MGTIKGQNQKRSSRAGSVVTGWPRWIERAVERLSPSIDVGRFELSERELTEQLGYGRDDPR